MTEQITLGEIGRKIDSLDSSVKKVLDDHESRLRSIEKWMYAVPPTLLIAIASVVASIMKG